MEHPHTPVVEEARLPTRECCLDGDRACGHAEVLLDYLTVETIE
jgi:hypothetical protein